MRQLAIALFLGIFVHASTLYASDFKPYIGLAAGTFKLKFTEVRGARQITLDKWTWGGILKGGVDYGDYIGAELRVGMTGVVQSSFPANVLGNTSGGTLSIQGENFFSYLIKPQYPVSELWKVYGLIGGTAASFPIDGAGSRLGYSSSKFKTGFTYGLGIEYQFRLKGSLSIEWIEYWRDVIMYHNRVDISKASMRGITFNINKSF